MTEDQTVLQEGVENAKRIFQQKDTDNYVAIDPTEQPPIEKQESEPQTKRRGRPAGSKNKPKPVAKKSPDEVIEWKQHGVHIYLDLSREQGVVYDDEGNVWTAKLVKVM